MFPCRIKLPPDTVTLLMTGLGNTLLTTLNTPFVKLKAKPAPGLPVMLAKLLVFVAPVPLNNVNFWPAAKEPFVAMFKTPP